MAKFNPLALLLGQQMSSEVPVPEYDPGEIVVTAPQKRPLAQMPDYNDAPAREKINPQYILNDNRIAPRSEELEEIIPRRGMFGVKGTLRNVLGLLGDAFLVQSGNDPAYRQRREQEQAGDAMFGATQNPMQAAERLAAMGKVEEAQQLLEQTQRNEYQQGQLASIEGSRQDQARNRQEDNLQKLVILAARRLKAAGDDPAAIEYAMQLSMQDAQRLGVSLADLGIMPGMDEPQRRVVAGSDITVNQQEMLPRRDQQLGISQQNADANTRNSMRPRNPPPRPRADTELEYYRGLSEIPEAERTPEEKAFMRRYIEGTRSGKSSTRRPVNTSTGTTTPLRLRQVRPAN